MKPNQIRSLMAKHQIKQADIAADLAVSPAAISSVIAGRFQSRRISEAVAKRIGLPVEKIWPRLAA